MKNGYYSCEVAKSGGSTRMVNTVTEDCGEGRFVGVQDGTVENREETECSLDYSSSQVC